MNTNRSMVTVYSNMVVVHSITERQHMLEIGYLCIQPRTWILVPQIIMVLMYLFMGTMRIHALGRSYG